MEGNGGKIDITTQGIFALEFRDRQTSKSDITASSEFGVHGTVDINNFGIDPSSGFIELPAALVDSSQQIATGCSGTVGSSFLFTGKGGMAQNPTQQINVNRTWSDIRDLSTYSQTTAKVAWTNKKQSNPQAIVEASHLIPNSKGEIELIAQADFGNNKSNAVPASCASVW